MEVSHAHDEDGSRCSEAASWTSSECDDEQVHERLSGTNTESDHDPVFEQQVSNRRANREGSSSIVRKYLRAPEELIERIWDSPTAAGRRGKEEAAQRGIDELTSDIAAGYESYLKYESENPIRLQEVFRFTCVFQFAGCNCNFPNRTEWKEHVTFEHLSQLYWICTEGLCGQIPNDDESGNTAQLETGTTFHHSHEFCRHLRLRHLSIACDTPTSIFKHAWLVDSEEAIWVMYHREIGVRTRYGLPTSLKCPVEGCRASFDGPTAWDQRLNHASKHFLASRSEQPPTVFGGVNDEELIRWASSPQVSIIQKSGTGDRWTLCHSPESRDRGYHGSNSPKCLGDCNEQVPTNLMGIEENSTDGNSRPLNTIRNTKFSAPPNSQCQISQSSNKLPRESSLDPDDGEPLGSTSGASKSYSDTSVDAATHSMEGMSLEPFTDAVDEALLESLMEWFKAWLCERLFPRTRQQIMENSDGDEKDLPNEGNNNNNNNSRLKRTLPCSTQDNGNGGQDRSKRRKKANGHEDEDEDGEEVRKTCERDNGRFACPFYKHNPRKYGQPQWRSCAHPGWEIVRRVKEHIYRCHRSPRPEYQCRRCLEDLKNEAALDSHSRMPVACVPPEVIILQDSISDTQEKLLRSKKRASTHTTEESRWYDVYQICFPDDEPLPSPYQTYMDETSEGSQINLVEEYRVFLARELPTLVRRQLPSMIGSSLESGLRDQIADMVRGQLNQLYHSFRNEVNQTRTEIVSAPVPAPALTSGSTESDAVLVAIPTTDSGSALQVSTEPYLTSGTEDEYLDWEQLDNFVFDFS